MIIRSLLAIILLCTMIVDTEHSEKAVFPHEVRHQLYHFTPRYLGGASAIVSNSIYDKRNISFNQNKWLIRAFFGVRL